MLALYQSQDGGEFAAVIPAGIHISAAEIACPARVSHQWPEQRGDMQQSHVAPTRLRGRGTFAWKHLKDPPLPSHEHRHGASEDKTRTCPLPFCCVVAAR